MEVCYFLWRQLRHLPTITSMRWKHNNLDGLEALKDAKTRSFSISNMLRVRVYVDEDTHRRRRHGFIAGTK